MALPGAHRCLTGPANQLDLLVLILSLPTQNGTARRAAIRQSWAQPVAECSVGFAFVLGTIPPAPSAEVLPASRAEPTSEPDAVTLPAWPRTIRRFPSRCSAHCAGHWTRATSRTCSRQTTTHTSASAAWSDGSLTSSARPAHSGCTQAGRSAWAAWARSTSSWRPRSAASARGGVGAAGGCHMGCLSWTVPDTSSRTASCALSSRQLSGHARHRRLRI